MDDTSSTLYRPDMENRNVSPEKPFRCSVCNRSFGRVEHLERHHLLHTREKHHGCACGVAFSRSDALLRHIKRCKLTEKSDSTNMRTKPIKRQRLTQACDRCALLKAKCGSSHPCERCNRRGVTCQYTRGRERTVLSSSPAETASSIEDVPQTMTGVPKTTALSSMVQLTQSSVQDVSDAEEWPGLAQPQADEHLTLNLAFQANDMIPEWLDWHSLDLGGDMSQWAQRVDGLSSNGGSCLDWAISEFTDSQPLPLTTKSRAGSSVPDVSTSGPAEFNFYGSATTRIPECFLLRQLDPLEAKSNDLRALVTKSTSSIPKETIECSLSRQSLLIALQNYAHNIRRHLPIVHSPSFSLYDTSDLLLLAMFCVGACYANIVKPPRYLYHIAICVLRNVEIQSWQPTMEVHTLSAIQASIFACSVLASSQDDFAHRAVPTYFAGTISMAKRSGIFNFDEVVDYSSLDEHTFCWKTWIERETRNRIANVLFCQDVARTIFCGNAPSFAPLELKIPLPSYEMCWEARSPKECLQNLQSTPRPPLLYLALRQLQMSSDIAKSDWPFEVSAFGMFTLAKALHCLIWHVTHYDLENASDICSTTIGSAFQGELRDLTDRLARDFKGQVIDTLLTKAVILRGSNTLIAVKELLDNWMTAWSCRQYHDLSHENIAFSLDPMPFLWLGKLFMLLHIGSTHIPEHSEFAALDANADSIKGTIHRQVTVIGWLSRLRRPQHHRQLQDQCSLAELMEPLE